jgi:ligand-binding sensor domain-containing protein
MLTTMTFFVRHRATLPVTISMLMLLAAIVTSIAQPVQLSNWRTISSMTTVRACSFDADSVVWAATAGGVFSYSLRTGAVEEFRNIDALTSLNCTAILFDSLTRAVVVGSLDGSIAIRRASGRWIDISDIRRAQQYPRKAIRGLTTIAGKLYICTDFGFCVFDLSREIFIETVDRLATFEERQPVYSVVAIGESLYAGTEAGLVYAPLNSITLRLPSLWKALDTANGLPPGGIQYLAKANETSLFAAQGSTVFRIEDNKATITATAPQSILWLSSDGNNRYTYGTASVVRTATATQQPINGTVFGGSTLWSTSQATPVVFVQGKGLSFVTGDSLQTVRINGPVSNLFGQIGIDKSGGLWVATDTDRGNNGVGVSYFANNVWRHYNPTSQPSIPSLAAYRLRCLSDGSVLAGFWGRNAARFIPPFDSVIVYDEKNSALLGITADPNYVLVGEAELDRSGALWMVNEQGSNATLTRVGLDGSSQSWANCSAPTSSLFRSMCIDNSGTKWLAGYVNGLLAINEKNTPDNPSDDVCNLANTGNSQLPDNSVNVVRTDANGVVWIGTSKGVATIGSPGSLSRTTLPFIRRISVLQAVNVNDIAVDAINNKWIATSLGVFVLNSDGTEVLATLTTTNTPLLDNNVRSIAVNPESGDVYLAQSSYCSIVRTQSIKPLSNVELVVWPQPFRPSENEMLTIDGLSADADVRIMTPSGIVVAALQARGRQALWNGLDTQGRVAPPGVYLVHVSSASTETSGIAKMLIAR